MARVHYWLFTFCGTAIDSSLGVWKMIVPKFPRQFIACACIVAVIIYGGFALFFDYNAEVFKWLFPALNAYPLWFFGARQWEKRKNGGVQAIDTRTDEIKKRKQ